MSAEWVRAGLTICLWFVEILSKPARTGVLSAGEREELRKLKLKESIQHLFGE